MDPEIIKAINDLHVIHHVSVYSNVLFKKILLKPILVPDNTFIVTISDQKTINKTDILHSNIPQESIKHVSVDTYIPWVTKVIELKNFIKLNYDNLPDYIIYLDKSDTIVVNHIPNPQEILNFYNCKILFNKEGRYGHDGCSNPSVKYYQDFLDNSSDKHTALIKKIYGVERGEVGLNAGAFLGEKKALLEILEEMLDFHYSKPHTEGFPYGWIDDQSVFRYMFLKYPNIIRLDLYSKIFTQAHNETYSGKTFDDSNFFNHYNKFENLFNNKAI